WVKFSATAQWSRISGSMSAPSTTGTGTGSLTLSRARAGVAATQVNSRTASRRMWLPETAPRSAAGPSNPRLPAASTHAAVDADHLAIDVTGLVRAQESHQRSHLVRRSGACGRHHLPDRGRVERGLAHASGDHP